MLFRKLKKYVAKCDLHHRNEAKYSLKFHLNDLTAKNQTNGPIYQTSGRSGSVKFSRTRLQCQLNRIVKRLLLTSLKEFSSFALNT